jgi:hypothetical protein
MEPGTLSVILGSLALVFLVANFITSLKITKVLSERGVNINYPLLHVRLYHYATLYKNITQKEEGEPGPLYKQFNITNWLFIAFLILGIASLYL